MRHAPCPRMWERPLYPLLGARHRSLCVPVSLVHPHVRGDGYLRFPLRSSPCGSPPRAWGRHGHGLLRSHPARFTPTCVGTAPCQIPYWGHCPVHPHPRGDDIGSPAQAICQGGSPPPAWGRLLCALLPRLARRFTPTRVGTTTCAAASRASSPVHPHPREDDYTRLQLFWLTLGSPPPAWGRHLAL